MREVVCRRYVLRLVKDALKAPTTASEFPRPSKRRKPNPQSTDVLSSLTSPQRKTSRSNTPSTPKGRPNHDIDSSDDDTKQDEFSGSGSSTSKAIHQSIRFCRLIIRCNFLTRQLEHRMSYLCKVRSHDKNKRPPGQRL